MSARFAAGNTRNPSTVSTDTMDQPDTVNTRSDLAARVVAWQRAGERIGLVPTMGNLHEGHLSLVRALRPQCDRLITSIFVNPLQFGPDEDLERYPRTLEADRKQLAAAGVDLVFAPGVKEIYPRGDQASTVVEVPTELTGQLCGRDRPGHFTGVATVVSKLFNLCRPDVAIFGEKDYQQLLVIRRLVEDLDFPVEVVSGPIVREDDGLAMSSRNHYLDPGERRRAPLLYRTLCELAEGLAAQPDRADALARQAESRLSEAGLEPDYVAVRDARTLGPPGAGPLRVLGAVRLGSTRLIDNVAVRPGAGT